MNITDVGHLVSDADEGEDKLEKGARRDGKTAWEIAYEGTISFSISGDEKDFKNLRVQKRRRNVKKAAEPFFDALVRAVTEEFVLHRHRQGQQSTGRCDNKS